MRLALFDVDGTLLDSRGVGRRAIARAIQVELGAALLQEGYRLAAYARRRAGAQVGRRVLGSELVVLGDTPADVRCGRAARARTIAVATGRFDLPTLRAAGADTVPESFEDTEAVVGTILD